MAIQYTRREQGGDPNDARQAMGPVQNNGMMPEGAADGENDNNNRNKDVVDVWEAHNNNNITPNVGLHGPAPEINKPDPDHRSDSEDNNGESERYEEATVHDEESDIDELT